MNATSIIGAAAVRISRVDADGTPDFDNADGAFALCGGISKFEHDYDVQEGKEIYEEDSVGNACVNVKRKNRTKRLTGTLTLCKRHPIIPEIVGVGQVIENTGNIVGFGIGAAQGCGETADSNGVIVELWSENYDCDELDADFPYIRHIIKRAHFTPKGYTIENGLSLPVFDLFGVPNENFGDGPFGDLDYLVGTDDDLVYIEVGDTALPSCPDPLDYIAIPASAS